MRLSVLSTAGASDVQVGKGAALILFNDVAGSWGCYKARQVRMRTSGGRVVGEHEGEKEPLS